MWQNPLQLVTFFDKNLYIYFYMSQKDASNEEEEVKDIEGELDADVLDGAFDDQGFGDEDQEEIGVPIDDEESEKSAEWNNYDDTDSW